VQSTLRVCVFPKPQITWLQSNPLTIWAKRLPYKKMKSPIQMYSKIGDLKIIQIKRGSGANPLNFVGSLNKKLTTGIIISSKVPQARKDGMSFKYFRFSYQLSQDIGKLAKIPLAYEYKLSNNPLLAKKYIKISGFGCGVPQPSFARVNSRLTSSI